MTTQTWPLHAVADPSVSLPARSIASLGNCGDAAEASGVYARVGMRRRRFRRTLASVLPVLVASIAIGCAAATVALAAS